MVTAFDLSLRHLDAAVVVARNGSISSASTAVNLSQPALTQALAKLEKLVGHRLFERQSHGTVPTNAGQLFITRAERGLERIVEGGRRFRRSAQLTPIAHLERIASMGQFRALNAVERAGSYALAAREIGLSQPSVHRAVKELELILGAPLFVPNGRSIRTTQEAVRLISSIRLMVAELQAGLDELEALNLEGAGRIMIGTLQLPRAGLLPEALARFARHHPYATIIVIEGPYGELLGQLRNGDLDLIVGALRDQTPTADVQQSPLFADDLFIVARADHPLVATKSPRLGALRSYPWVIGAHGAPMRDIWEAMFSGSKLPVVRVECSSVLIARGLLLEDNWLALMYPDQFRIEQAAGLLAPIGRPVTGSRRSIGITTRADWQPTATQAALVLELEAAGARRSSAI